jgi:hypothetical protein
VITLLLAGRIAPLPPERLSLRPPAA